MNESKWHWVKSVRFEGWSSSCSKLRRERRKVRLEPVQQAEHRYQLVLAPRNHRRRPLPRIQPLGRSDRRTNNIPGVARKSNVARTIVTLIVLVSALLTATAATATTDARRWYWTERHTQAEITLTDGEDLYGRQPAAIIRGGYISDKVDCTGFPPLLRRNGLRLYRLLKCVVVITETDLNGEEVTSYWEGTITPKGREDYLARWRRYA